MKKDVSLLIGGALALGVGAYVISSKKSSISLNVDSNSIDSSSSVENISTSNQKPELPELNNNQPTTTPISISSETDSRISTTILSDDFLVLKPKIKDASELIQLSQAENLQTKAVNSYEIKIDTPNVVDFLKESDYAFLVPYLSNPTAEIDKIKRMTLDGLRDYALDVLPKETRDAISLVEKSYLTLEIVKESYVSLSGKQIPTEYLTKLKTSFNNTKSGKAFAKASAKYNKVTTKLKATKASKFIKKAGNVASYVLFAIEHEKALTDLSKGRFTTDCTQLLADGAVASTLIVLGVPPSLAFSSVDMINKFTDMAGDLSRMLGIDINVGRMFNEAFGITDDAEEKRKEAERKREELRQKLIVEIRKSLESEIDKSCSVFTEKVYTAFIETVMNNIQGRVVAMFDDYIDYKGYLSDAQLEVNGIQQRLAYLADEVVRTSTELIISCTDGVSTYIDANSLVFKPNNGGFIAKNTGNIINKSKSSFMSKVAQKSYIVDTDSLIYLNYVEYLYQKLLFDIVVELRGDKTTIRNYPEFKAYTKSLVIRKTAKVSEWVRGDEIIIQSGDDLDFYAVKKELIPIVDNTLWDAYENSVKAYFDFLNSIDYDKWGDLMLYINNVQNNFLDEIVYMYEQMRVPDLFNEFVKLNGIKEYCVFNESVEIDKDFIGKIDLSYNAQVKFFPEKYASVVKLNEKFSNDIRKYIAEFTGVNYANLYGGVNRLQPLDYIMNRRLYSIEKEITNLRNKLIGNDR